MFVTWRYVALRTFTLRRDAPFGSFSPASGAGKKDRSLGRREKQRRGRKILPPKRRDAKRRNRWTKKQRRGRERGGRTESLRVFCFAAFLRNFYDYRLSGSPSARIGPLRATWLHEQPRTTCDFTTFTFKRLLAAILGPELHSSFISASVFRSSSSSSTVLRPSEYPRSHLSLFARWLSVNICYL